MASAPDFKTGKRIVDPEACDRYVEEVGACMGCGELNVVWYTPGGKRKNSLNFDHIVPRSQGGDDVPENGFVLCGSGVHGCHGDRHKSVRTPIRGRGNDYVRPIRLKLRMVLERHPEKMANATAKKSEAWVERMFPAKAK